jgi:hypothetical protein
MVLAYICKVSQPIVFYTTHTTARLQYIVSFLFESVLKKNITFVNSLSNIDVNNNTIINYSHQHIEGAFQIEPHTLLFDTKIINQKIEVVLKNETPIFFENNSMLGFDIFAASFYLLTRYEEYLPHDVDAYDRFSHTNSLAFKHHFLQLPLINIWAIMLWQQLQVFNTTLPNYTPSSNNLFTYDVDMAYAYKHKGFVRQAKIFFKNLMQFKFKKIQQQFAIIKDKANDPFDNFTRIVALHLLNKTEPIFFILCAKQISRYNKNNTRDAPDFIKLLNYIKTKAIIGIHPSYNSSNNVAILSEEKNWLQANIQSAITANRQHYIKFTMPDTFEQLISNGITSDYSMGYGSINGFRASTSNAHLFFNLNANQVRPLSLYPFCWMDANALYEQHFNAQEALTEYVHYKKIVQLYGGTFISVWHNFIISNEPAFKNYCTVYANAMDA